MIKTLLALFLMAQPPLPEQPSQNVPAETEEADDYSRDLEEAQRLYQEGSLLFDTADYDGAIKAFTHALAIVDASPDADERMQQILYYNIASAHEKAFDTDKELKHLRQALELYRKFRDYASWQDVASSTPEAQEDLRHVKARIADIERRLKVADQLEENRRRAEEQDKVPPPPPAPSTEWKKPRNIGIGLVATGAGAVVGGVIIAAAGSQLRPNAEDQVQKLAQMGIPMDHPAWAEGDKFIEQETRKGRTTMALGGTLAGVGAIGTGLGVFYLVKAKKLKEGQVTPTVSLSPGFVGVKLEGRF